jgi:hypothetical protein
MAAMTILALAIALVLAVAVLISANRAGQIAVPDIRVLSQLRQAGSKLSEPHKIDFFLYFPTEEAAASVARELTAQGFSTEIKLNDQSQSEWLVQAVKTMIPKVSVLVGMRENFSALAAANGGAYDGWGAEVVR